MSALPDIKIGQLRNFVAVVDHQGFKAAARSLFRSQPAISISVKELENLIGAALFEKNMQSELTPFGKQFYFTAKKLLEHYNSSIRGAVDLAHLNAGQVRVAIVPSVARDVLPRTLTRFIASHPNIEIWVEDGDANYVRERVATGNVDFGCSGGASNDARLSFTKVTSDVMGVVCSADHPLAMQKHATWQQLDGQTLISNGSMRLIDKALIDPLLRNSKMHIANITSLLGLIEANVGITILPSLAFPKLSEGICFVPIKSPVAKRTIGILQLAEVSLNPAAEEFRSELIADLEVL
ncbi:LysR family transcriptional regulator [Glaciimonas sp. PCH181]|uniref:LysR family transcriptional regulator n=1 Tax=Glaciimonas sp. PCH181 TaxID=2133943 RepID=UPI001374B57A|nr:LysR family transcriptional regulator [Glaciimonas sp. PCH181]